MIDLKQKELADWQERNFGNQDDNILKVALGMAEEVGEVCHHVLKGSQGIRGGINGINKAEVADGVADVLIYGLQLLSGLDMDAEKEISAVIDKVLKRDWKKNPEGDKKNIQDQSTTFGESIPSMIRRMNKDINSPISEQLMKSAAKELSDKKDSLIKEAITFMIGEDWVLEDIKRRGTFGIFPDGKEVFSFDGRSLLEFHGISSQANIGSLKTTIELMYKKLY